MPLTVVKGSTWNTLNNVYVDTIHDLDSAEREGIVFVSGGLRVNDGSGGIFKYEAGLSRTRHDGTDVVDPTGSKKGNGCWVRQRFYSAPAGSSFSEVQAVRPNQQTFRLTKFTYTPNTGDLAVYVNGVRLTPDVFTEDDSQTITLHYQPKVGDLVEFIGHDRPTAGTLVRIDALSVNFDPTTSRLVSTDVQHALEELSRSVGTGGGGGAGFTNAKDIPYAGLSPDTSRNVQDALHFFHNSIWGNHGHLSDTSAHPASNIVFDSRRSLLGVNNVQAAIDILKGLIDGLGTDDIIYSPTEKLDVYLTRLQNEADDTRDLLGNHLRDLTDAHTAGMISYSGANHIYQNVRNVKEAFDEIGRNLDTHTHTAANTTYNNSNSTLRAVDVKAALDEIFSEFLDHVGGTSRQHNSRSINHIPTGGMVSRNVSDAVLENWNRLKSHVNDLQDAHFASAIGFSTVNNGFRSSTVQDAIVEAAGVGMIYRGNLDLTSPRPATSKLLTNSYYTSSVAGPIHADWTALGTDFPTNAVIGDFILSDGVTYWYLRNTGPSLSQAILRTPGAGDSQTIQSADPLHTVLTLRGVTAQTAPLLNVAGTITADKIDSRTEVVDQVGNVRQEADDVPYNPAASNLVSTTVKDALDELDQMVFDHENLVNAHAAQNITAIPTGTLVGNSVQELLTELETAVSDHIARAVRAHDASAIFYDNSLSNLTASNIQDAIDQTIVSGLPAGGATDMFLNKASNADYDVVWTDTIDLGTY